MTQKIRTATEFRGIVPKGGSTKPWLVEASDVEGNTELYVVKMFTPKQIRQQNALAESTKKIIFSDFVERLRLFDPFMLEDIAQFLIDNAHPVGNLELIQDYLLAVQRAPERFGALLQKQLI